MARKWTVDQKKVIDLHSRNILVSAAAGSGKTAVLVERIIRMVTDPDRKIDIDKLVVVTFTKAAAGEMRQRISEAIEEQLELNPDDENLQKQLTLVHNAQITTIDSFCLNLIRNNFTAASIDPGFRTADEGELKLLEADIMEKILEEYYNSDRQDFFDFIDSYGTGKSDSAVEAFIYKVYQFSRSYPWPEEWLDECSKVYEIDNEDILGQHKSIEFLTKYVKKIMVDYDLQFDKLMSVCMEADGPFMYQPMIASDQMQIKNMLDLNTFDELRNYISQITFDKLSSKRGPEVDPEKKEYVKYYRNLYKGVISDLQSKIFKQSMKQNLEDIKINAGSILVLIELTKRFYEEMRVAKREKNIIDFNDMEHLALDILVKKENNLLIYSEVADRLSDFYEEILIDEYQDSNLLQDQILFSISKGRKDPKKNNVFMVGDVKQSIYKFRLARPELFIEKYNTYSTEDDFNQKIELRMNFRSRDNVLKSVNDIFFHIMKSYFGGIEYDQNVMLNTGLEFSAPEDEYVKRVIDDTEIIIINSKMEKEDKADTSHLENIDSENRDVLDEEEQEYLERELEATQIANRIKELVDPDHGHMIFDFRMNAYRPALYKDIVILTRTVSGWADTFVNVLMNNGIEAYSDSASGYFNSREIKLLLSFLSIIDNPIQDIPLAAVMLSYFGDFNSQELANIRLENPSVKLYNSLLQYSGQDLDLKTKVYTFLEKLNNYRKKSIYMDIHELIWKIIYDTGYYDYVGSMPAGVKRQANLDMLIEKAKSYEATSYRGLFHFLRYIEKLKKYDVDYGEATVLGENENLVRVMSIHKSKGLEFPIVFLAGMSKPFNNMDSFSNMVIDAQLGIGANAVNLDNRTKTPTIIKQSIGLKLRLENMYEELRILYVALTRAKEKLIMIGTITKSETFTVWKSKAAALEDGSPFAFAELEKCSNYFDFVVPTALKTFGNQGKFQVNLLSAKEVIDFTKDNTYDSKSLEEDAKKEDVKKENAKKEDEIVSDGAELNEFINFVYPYETQTFMKSKMTVSELKKLQIVAEGYNPIIEDSEFHGIHDEEEVRPRFITGEQKLQGAERGTAYHRCLECFDYHYSDSVENVKEYLEILKNNKKISKQQFQVIDPLKIYQFCSSKIGQRIRKEFEKSLRREQQFVYGIEPVENEMILVQGVIDLYFEEGENIIIVDYKTDHIPKNESGKQMLIDRYRVQLDYYAQAISQITGKKVSEKIIYSFELEEEISL